MPGLLRPEQLRHDCKQLHLHHVQLCVLEFELGHRSDLYSRQEHLLLRESVAGVLQRRLGAQMFFQLLHFVERLPWGVLLDRGYHVLHLAVHPPAASCCVHLFR